MIELDEAKRQANLAKHGVDFTAIDGFDWPPRRLSRTSVATTANRAGRLLA